MKATFLLILSTITTAFCEDPSYPILQPPGPDEGGESNETEGFCETSDNFTMLDTRTGLINTKYRWKSFNVYIDPYKFNSSERQTIVDAFNELKGVLVNCPSITFYLYPYGRVPGSEDHVHVYRQKGIGCRSQTGRNGGKQYTWLWYDCIKRGTIMHELMHALGMYHEQAIHYRDQYVTIWWDNILPKFKTNFDPQNSNYVGDFGVPYNTKSIMHYRSDAASANGKYTITDKNKGWVGTEGKLQETDKQKLRKMHNC